MFRPCLIASLFLASCGPAGTDGGAGSGGGCESNDPPTCNVTAPEVCPDPPVTFTDVEPIFDDHCVSCHDGNGEQWPLTDYAHVAGWYAEIRGLMLDCSMPPPEECDDMNDSEREHILTWIRCGALE